MSSARPSSPAAAAAAIGSVTSSRSRSPTSTVQRARSSSHSLVLRPPAARALEAGVRYSLPVAADVVDAARDGESGDQRSAGVLDVERGAVDVTRALEAGTPAVEQTQAEDDSYPACSGETKNFALRHESRPQVGGDVADRSVLVDRARGVDESHRGLHVDPDVAREGGVDEVSGRLGAEAVVVAPGLGALVGILTGNARREVKDGLGIGDDLGN